MSVTDNREFKFALRDISSCSLRLENPFDRIRCTEWIRKLTSLSADNIETSKIRNEYVQLLKIQVCNGFLHGIFKTTPSEAPILAPLAENLTNIIVDKIPDLPRAGPIAPIVRHSSPDGRAYVSIKQIKDGGVFCYMTVNPNGINK